MTEPKEGIVIAERVYWFAEMDKAEWGDGPWNDEPDKFVWVDDATGLDCMIVRNYSGALCGYVGVPEGHPWFEVDYPEVDAQVEVHGGLTFADHCQPGSSEHEHAVCHNDEARPANVWWLGFDCAHYRDIAPGLLADQIRVLGRMPAYSDGAVYRSVDYVRAEVVSLAGQAAAVLTG